MSDRQMPIRAVIFDKDGTLHDTEQVFARAWRLAADEFGVPDMDTTITDCTGRTLPDIATYWNAKYPDIPFDVYIPRRQYYFNAIITDGNNRVRFLRNNSTLLPRSDFPYFSLLPADPKVRGVSIDGAKYPLKKATLLRNNPSLAVSNEIVGNCALIDVRRGGVWVIESRA